MEVVEFNSILLESRADSGWACYPSPSLECCILMSKNPMMVGLCPKPFTAQINSISGPFDVSDLLVNSKPNKPETVLPNTEPINIETVSQLLLNPSLSNTDLPWIHRIGATPSSACWSPGNTSIFVMLHSDGEVSFWDGKNKCFLLWMTDTISKLYFSNPIKLADENIPKIKSVSESLFVTAICWSDVIYDLENEIFAYLVTAHKSGKINIWKVVFSQSWNFQLDFNLKYTITTSDKNVTSVHWISSSDDCATLIYGNSQGQVHGVSLNISKIHEFSSDEKVAIFSDKDRISVDKIMHIPQPENLICLIVIKLSYFLTFILDQNLKVIHLKFEDLSNRITGIKQMDENNLIVSTLTGTIYHLNLFIDPQNNPNIDLEKITCSVNFDEWSLKGIYVTKNNAFFIMILTPSKTIFRKRGKVMSKIIYAYFKNVDCIKTILDNNSQKLTNYWDILELYRVYHNLSLLPADQPIKFTDDMMYETKASMWFNIIKHPHYEKEELFKTILLNHVKVSLAKQIDDLKQNKVITDFDMKTMSCYMNFLREHNGDLADQVLQDLKEMNVPIISVTKHCDFCGENFKSLSCSNNHQHQWCCVTLQEINDLDYYFCSMCKSIAHRNLDFDNLKCIFCDLFFEKNIL